TEARVLLFAWIVVLLAMALIGVVTKQSAQISRMWMGTWFVAGTAALLVLRVVLRHMQGVYRASGYNQRRMVIVGTGSLAEQVANQLIRSRWTGLQLLGFF